MLGNNVANRRVSSSREPSALISSGSDACLLLLNLPIFPNPIKLTRPDCPTPPKRDGGTPALLRPPNPSLSRVAPTPNHPRDRPATYRLERVSSRLRCAFQPVNARDVQLGTAGNGRAIGDAFGSIRTLAHPPATMKQEPSRLGKGGITVVGCYVLTYVGTVAVPYAYRDAAKAERRDASPTKECS